MQRQHCAAPRKILISGVQHNARAAPVAAIEGKRVNLRLHVVAAVYPKGEGADEQVIQRRLMRLIEKDPRVWVHLRQLALLHNVGDVSKVTGLVVGLPGRDDCAIQQGQDDVREDDELLRTRKRERFCHSRRLSHRIQVIWNLPH